MPSPRPSIWRAAIGAVLVACGLVVGPLTIYLSTSDWGDGSSGVRQALWASDLFGGVAGAAGSVAAGLALAVPGRLSVRRWALVVISALTAGLLVWIIAG